MRAETAAAYLDEVSVQAFRRKVGSVYPAPIGGRGRRQKWDREDLDAAISAMKGLPSSVLDAASVL
jgi:hypothetical protein